MSGYIDSRKHLFSIFETLDLSTKITFFPETDKKSRVIKASLGSQRLGKVLHHILQREDLTVLRFVINYV